MVYTNVMEICSNIIMQKPTWTYACSKRVLRYLNRTVIHTTQKNNTKINLKTVKICDFRERH